MFLNKGPFKECPSTPLFSISATARLISAQPKPPANRASVEIPNNDLSRLDWHDRWQLPHCRLPLNLPSHHFPFFLLSLIFDHLFPPLTVTLLLKFLNAPLYHPGAARTPFRKCCHQANKRPLPVPCPPPLTSCRCVAVILHPSRARPVTLMAHQGASLLLPSLLDGESPRFSLQCISLKHFPNRFLR